MTKVLSLLCLRHNCAHTHTNGVSHPSPAGRPMCAIFAEFRQSSPVTKHINTELKTGPMAKEKGKTTHVRVI